MLVDMNRYRAEAIAQRKEAVERGDTALYLTAGKLLDALAELESARLRDNGLPVPGVIW